MHKGSHGREVRVRVDGEKTLRRKSSGMKQVAASAFFFQSLILFFHCSSCLS